MHTAKENITALPEFCYGRLLADNSLIGIHAGEAGYRRKVNHPLPDSVHQQSKDEVEAFIDEQNKALGVTKGQREAMEIGSMFGWEVAGADPLNYNDDGTRKVVS